MMTVDLVFVSPSLLLHLHLFDLIMYFIFLCILPSCTPSFSSSPSLLFFLRFHGFGKKIYTSSLPGSSFIPPTIDSNPSIRTTQMNGISTYNMLKRMMQESMNVRSALNPRCPSASTFMSWVSKALVPQTIQERLSCFCLSLSLLGNKKSLLSRFC